MRLSNKVAIVTGAAQGIGRAIALHFANEGADLGLLDLNGEGLTEVAAEIDNAGQRVVVCAGNVSDKETVDRFHQQVQDELGAVHVLVNNAGVFSRAPFLEMSEEDWDLMMDVHLKGTVLCCQASIRQMLENEVKGSIINLASISSYVGYSWSAAYCTAKGGIVTLTKVLANEFGPQGIRVNAMAPGIIDTSMNTWFLGDDEMRSDSVGHIPLSYVGEPQTVADVALFLATENSRYVTGVTIPVDGGYLTH